MNHACPCCGYFTLDEAPSGTFAVCPVCYWEDDNVQADDPTYDGGANGMSLNQARQNFSKYGAIKKEFVKNVRKALPEECDAHHDARAANVR